MKHGECHLDSGKSIGLSLYCYSLGYLTVIGQLSMLICKEKELLVVESREKSLMVPFFWGGGRGETKLLNFYLTG